MKRTCMALCAAALTAPAAADVTVGVDPSGPHWLGFMNVFELDGTTHVFGSPWGTADLNATFDDPNNKLTLSPNTIGDPDPFWYQGGGGPGAPGNKIMEANLYQEIGDGSFSGMTVTFEGNIISDTFTAAHEAKIFIRDWASDFSSVNETIVDADAGAFSISLATIADPTRIVQWGFQVKGVNVWVTDTAPFGNMMIATPAPAGLALLAMGGTFAARRRRG